MELKVTLLTPSEGGKLVNLLHNSTGCGSHFRNPAPFNILKKPLLVLKQTIHQQKALYFSFNLAPWKWACHYHEAATPSCPQITFFTPRGPMLFAARGCGTLLMMPHPLSRCQINAEIQGFLLMYDVWFCTSTGSFRILKKAGRKISKKIISAIS